MSDRGFTMIEVLVTLIALSAMMLGLVQVFQLQHRTHAHEDVTVELEENLRLAADAVSGALRNARYASPPIGLVRTVFPTAFPGTATNPYVVNGGSAPDTISVAGCFEGSFAQPIASLSSPAVADPVAGTFDTTLSITSALPLAQIFDTGTRSLIRIGDAGNAAEYAVVTSVGSTTISIDTNVSTGGNQGVTFTHAPGARICRIDAYTFSIATDAASGVASLHLDENQGEGPQVFAEGITFLDVQLPAPRRYEIAITAESERRDPTMSGGSFKLSRSRTATVALRN